MQIGAIVSISVTTAFIADAPDPGWVLAWCYAAWCVVLLVMGLVARIPEHQGVW